jgi:hypothetical protein
MKAALLLRVIRQYKIGDNFGLRSPSGFEVLEASGKTSPG